MSTFTGFAVLGASAWAQRCMVADLRNTKRTSGISRVTSLLLVSGAVAQILYNMCLPAKPQLGFALVLQSITTLAAQCWLMSTAVSIEYAQRAQGGASVGAALRVKRKYGVDDEKALLAGDILHLWAWDDTASYLLFVLTLFTTGYLLTSFLYTHAWYVQGLGLLAGGIDAVAWIPQAVGHAQGWLPLALSPPTAVALLVSDVAYVGHAWGREHYYAMLPGCLRLASHAVLLMQVGRSTRPPALHSPADGQPPEAASTGVLQAHSEGLRGRR